MHKAILGSAVALALFTLTSCTQGREGGPSDAAAGPGFEAWKLHGETLNRRPDVLRRYTFQTVAPESPEVVSEAGEREPLKYASKEPLQIVEGRWPGKKAVRLDRGCFEGKPFDVKDKSFTVEIWFCKHGQGAELGNGGTGGMIFAQGDGYWSGFRAWTDYPARRLVFALGRPKPGHAFHLPVEDSVPDGVWHHLAAAWDGRRMRLYLNGLLLGSADYAGDYTPPGGPFKVGFADAGIGSLKMDVDEAAVYGRALSPAEVLQSAHFHAPLGADLKARFARAMESSAENDWSAAGTELAGILDLGGVHPEYRSLARLALARTLDKRNRSNEALAEYAKLLDDPSAPASFRQTALRLCARWERGVASPWCSQPVYERLLEVPDLGDAERVAVRVNLAERRLRDRDFAAARKDYDLLAALPQVPEGDRWNLRLQAAHSRLYARDYAAARAAYAKLAGDAGVPPEVRAYAMLGSAHAFARQRRYAEAAGAFAALRDVEAAPPHLRLEAEERMTEMKRLAQGLPARDPAASRVKIPPSPRPGATFYVAPDGADANPGTRDRPLATLTRARDAIRELRTRGGLPAGGIAVLVRGGRYRATGTLELAAEDSGTDQSPVVYAACPAEKPVFSGGVTVKGFTLVKAADTLARLPEEARGKVWQADLKAQGIRDYGRLGPRGFGLSGYPCRPWVDLYVDGRPMTLARWPNTGFVSVGEVYAGKRDSAESGKPGVFEYEGDRPARWRQANDLWMFGYWGYLWEARGVKVASVEPEKRRIATAQPSAYGFFKGQPYYYFNLLEEIDSPGEWYLDREAGTLYLYPPSDLAKATVELAMLEAPFLKLTGVSHVIVRGLTFECGRADGAVIAGGRHNLLAGCTFRRLGASGVILDGGTEHGVLGCDIHTLGAGGIHAKGGDLKTLTPGGHFIENNHVYDFTRVDRVYGPAVNLDGVGNRVAHNLFHDSPHQGMRVEGYGHVIEYNEVHSVVYESDDQGGVDMYGNPAYRGNVFRFNFWHHVGSGQRVAGQSGIRLDDMISGVLMYGNVFYRCSGGQFGAIQIHGGKDNIADNNLIIDCKYAFSFSPWGEKRWQSQLASDAIRKAMAAGGADITQPPYSIRYPDLARLKEDPDRNFLRRNLAVRCGRFSVRETGVNSLIDNHVLADDPGFADPARLDFRLKDDSPVYDRFPFRPIPFGEIGLYADERRATWPVASAVTPRYVREY
jgi:hypothetical protein